MSINLGPEDFAGGGDAVRFDDIGDSVEGTIVGARRQQMRDYDTGQPITWDNGEPKWEYLFDLNVDGEAMTLYARNQLWVTVRDAIKETSPSGLPEVGGTLKVRFDSLGEPKKKGYSPPKLYKARYQPAPAPAALSEDEF